MAAAAPARKTTKTPTRTGVTIDRRFTYADYDVFDLFTWTTRSSKIVNPNGKVVFDAPEIEVPDTWSQVATDVWASKFARKAGVPQRNADGTPKLDDQGQPILGMETSVKQEATRLANAWKIWGERGGYFATPADADAFRDEIAYMYVAQMASPNSPQHFNTGLYEAYGITGDPEGNSFYNEASGKVEHTTFKHQRSAANACFIQSVADDLVGPGGIMDGIVREARLFQAGSGSGSNYSRIRGAVEKLSGGGTSSGVMSFLKVHDAGAGAIKSGGTTRRAAKMVILDVDHPEIELFIDSKVREEDKVAALIAAGYDSAYDGEAYLTVAFQNANHSVRLTSGFMTAVENDDDWHLTARTTGEIVKTIPARELWNKIAYAAWRCADPGLQFDDIINDWHTGANDGRQRGTNPCSEYLYLDDTACNLASINLGKFYNATTAQFDVEAYEHAVRLWTIVLEITVSMSHYPSEIIAKNSYEHRTLGLGYANIGATLMRAGLPYDSDEGRAVMAALAGIMTMRAYATSAELANAVGTAPAYQRNAEHVHRVLRNHRRVAYGDHHSLLDLGDFEQLTVTPVGVDHEVLLDSQFANLSRALLNAADEAVDSADVYGVRNMQVTVLAPTGTIGLQMDCDTTGIEPDFALVKFKKLAGGGYMKIANSSVPTALHALGYDEDAVNAIIDYAVGTATFHGDTPVNRASLKAKGLSDAAFDKAEAAAAGAFDIKFAVAPFVLGEDVMQDLGIKPETYNDPDFNLLAHLGYSKADIKASNDVIVGHGTVEGAPGLAAEHLPVFDTATESGDGTRYIHWSGHVKALGAVAGLLSGSVSKTVNLPNSASIEDFEQVHATSYKLGVKAVALYRDGSKLSAPLSGKKDAESELDEALAAETFSFNNIPAGVSPTAFYGEHRPPRFDLPTIRLGHTIETAISGTKLFIHCGTYADGTLGEVFVETGKDGTTLRGMLSGLSIMISKALQHGMPVEKVVDSLRGQNFAPHGIVTGHPVIKMANSIPDLVARHLAWVFLGDLSQVQIQTPASEILGTPAVGASALAVSFPENASVPADEAGAAKSDGKLCDDCGGLMVPNGTCHRCTECGSTTGCS